MSGSLPPPVRRALSLKSRHSINPALPLPPPNPPRTRFIQPLLQPSDPPQPCSSYYSPRSAAHEWRCAVNEGGHRARVIGSGRLQLIVQHERELDREDGFDPLSEIPLQGDFPPSVPSPLAEIEAPPGPSRPPSVDHPSNSDHHDAPPPAEKPPIDEPDTADERIAPDADEHGGRRKLPLWCIRTRQRKRYGMRKFKRKKYKKRDWKKGAIPWWPSQRPKRTWKLFYTETLMYRRMPRGKPKRGCEGLKLKRQR
ncbi:unnamed protein product [Vitrella brassicaformis CCMP3155]|uniref:Uncharacterized protein n=2 Tax=Vitrella brassicaformis TaxID=1169539 RepID=A0A0G4H7V5_VITBC|nr:unnamed protein product [Vitrella brassicaformis CCMP3155]|eukprot:CEM39844.1 unnamed protein product [Vitrella brassicaformis CCMP3155]